MSKKEANRVKAKVLRAFQSYEVGDVVEIETHRLGYLEDRKMVAALDTPTPESNRAVGLEGSEKKVSKRAK